MQLGADVVDRGILCFGRLGEVFKCAQPCVVGRNVGESFQQATRLSRMAVDQRQGDPVYQAGDRTVSEQVELRLVLRFAVTPVKTVVQRAVGAELQCL